MANNTNVTKAQLEQENNELKNSLSEMQEQMKMMMEQMKNIQSAPNTQYVGVKDDITTRKIPVISLIHNPAILSTEQYGAGTPYQFPEYGTERKIKFTDLERIVNLCKTIAFDTNNESSFFERGEFYICDAEAVEELGLESFYENIFTKEMVDKCIELKDETAINIFKGANDSIKESIVHAIVDNINSGGSYDLNLLAILSKAYGQDIQELAEKDKQISIKNKK